MTTYTVTKYYPFLKEGYFKEATFSNLEMAKRFARKSPDGSQVTIKKYLGYEYVETHVGVKRQNTYRTIGRYHVMSNKLISDVKKKKNKPAPFGL